MHELEAKTKESGKRLRLRFEQEAAAKSSRRAVVIEVPLQRKRPKTGGTFPGSSGSSQQQQPVRERLLKKLGIQSATARASRPSAAAPVRHAKHSTTMHYQAKPKPAVLQDFDPFA